MSDGISDYFTRQAEGMRNAYPYGDLVGPMGCGSNVHEVKEGLKYDGDKSRVDLVPYELIDEVGKVLAFGAAKYSEGNWSKGIDQKRLIAAAIRHTYQYSNGEDLDPESGLCHLAHAACNLAFALWMRKHRPDLDSRWSKQNQAVGIEDASKPELDTRWSKENK